LNSRGNPGRNEPIVAALVAASLLVVLVTGCSGRPASIPEPPRATHWAADEIPSSSPERASWAGRDLWLVVLAQDDSRTVAAGALERFQDSRVPHVDRSVFVARTDGFDGLEHGHWIAAVPFAYSDPGQKMAGYLGSFASSDAVVQRVRVLTDLPLNVQSGVTEVEE